MGIYQHAGAPSYSATTGAIVRPTTEYSVPLIVSRYDRREIDGEAIRAEDQKALIAVKDLPIVPTVNDTLVLADGTTWNVIGIQTDPSGSVWVLQLRKP